MAGSLKHFNFRRMAMSGLVIVGALLSAVSNGFAGSFSQESDYSNHAPWNRSKPVGVPFTVYGVDNVPDLHGDPIHADLVLFVGGTSSWSCPDSFQPSKGTIHPSGMSITKPFPQEFSRARLSLAD